MIHLEQEQLEIVKIFSSLFNKLKKDKDILSLYKKQKTYLLNNINVEKYLEYVLNNINKVNIFDLTPYSKHIGEIIK